MKFQLLNLFLQEFYYHHNIDVVDLVLKKIAGIDHGEARLGEEPSSKLDPSPQIH